MVPGSVLVTIHDGQTGPSITFTDNGIGQAIRTSDSGGSNMAVVSVNLDYEAGTVAILHSNNSDPKVITSYLPAAAVFQTAHTSAIEITMGTRGTVYTPALKPIPAPGSLIVDYRALGKWYRLRDDGKGVLTGGDKAYGTGTVDFVTGGTIITLGALPDVGSSILLSWGSPAHYEILSALPSASFSTTLTQLPVKPGSVVLSWTEQTITGPVNRTVTDNGLGGFSGALTGTIVYTTGLISAAMTVPITGDMAVAYVQSAPAEVSASNAFGYAIVARTVKVTGVRYILPDGSTSGEFILYDNGEGLLRGYVPSGYFYDYGGNGNMYVGGTATPYTLPNDHVFGTVDYTTGLIALNGTAQVSGGMEWRNSVWSPKPIETATLVPTSLVYQATKSGIQPAGTPATQSVTLGTTGIGLSLKLAPLKPMLIVANSLLFTAFGKRYIDRNGLIYTDVNIATGSGFLVGAINYANGVISLNDYPNGGNAPGFAVLACLGKRGDYSASSMSFRTAGSPLRPASTFVQVVAENGTLLSATSNQNGEFSAPQIRGTMEQTMGVCDLYFGQVVAAAGNETAWWYKAENVTGGMIYRPTLVMPDTLRYSTVVLTSLPLNADILGLDPVRLPSDGRVPIYKPADVVVLHHTESLAIGFPAAGSTHTMGRTGLSMMWLEDAAGAKLPQSKFVSNLDAGTVTMAADADLTGFMLPISAKHRIEEMGLLTDVQINGQIELAAPLLRDYPLGSYVSSALLFGDLFARVTGVFDQDTWDGTWSDTRIGNQAAAQFNDVDYPLEVLNDAATTERWRLSFTSATTYQVIGEQLGVIATGTTTVDTQPLNALTGKAYFTIRKNAFGAGWAVGNQLRFNTVGATPPFWLARTVLPGASLAGDSFDAQLRGDVD